MNILTPAQLISRKRSGWEILPTTYDMTYKSQWNNPWFFIREFYQNSLDEHDEARVATLPSLTMTAKGLVVQDQGRGLGAESLLMRESKETGDLRGHFGEGLKYACLVAVRLGYTPRIESPNAIIEAYASPKKIGKIEANVLTFLYKEPAESNRIGTKIIVEGYTGELYKDRFTTFLGKPIFIVDKEIGRYKRHEAIYTEPKGRLYVGDIYLRDLEDTQYSYNLWGLAVNPDRVSEIDNNMLKAFIGAIWSHADTKELIIRILKALTTDNTFESTIGGFMSAPYGGDKKVWLEGWEQLFSKRAVLWTNKNLSKTAEGYGYDSIGENWAYNARRFFSWWAPTDDSIVTARSKELTAPKSIPDNELSHDQLTNLKLVRYLTDTCTSCLYDGIKPKIIAAIIPSDIRTGQTLLGVESRDEGSIYLTKTVLSTQLDALSTYYHEMGHWVGGEGAVDGSMEHTRSVQNVGAAMFLIQQLHPREINEILEIAPPAPPPPPKETPIMIRETVNYPKIRYSVVDLDRMYGTDELKALAKERNLSTSGSKKDIAYQLLSNGFKPGEAPAEKVYPKVSYTPGITFGREGGV